MLSSLNQLVAAELRRNPELALSRVDLHHKTIPPFLHEYPYIVGAWPVFLDRRIVREHFESLVASIPGVLYRALRARFNDSAAMVEYFGWPELIYHVLQEAPIDARDVLIRYDAVLNDGGLKILENNCGSSATGWEADYFEPQMRAHMARFAPADASSFSYRRILHSLLKAIAGSICRRKPDGTRGNLLVHSTLSPRIQDLADFRDSLQSIYDAVKTPSLAAGRVAIFRNFDELGFTAAGELTFQGEVIDAILLGDALYMGIPNALLNRLITAYLREQLIFPDSPFHAVLSDKGLLAVAHECRSENLLDASDSAIIARYIPWTGWLRDDEVLLEGVRVKLVPHLLAHKDDFVIKKFDSSSGRHVVVGRYVSSETWERAVRANVEARWIVQQHCAPGTLDVHDAELGVVPHALIWGVCGYGAEYGGAFIRAARIGRHSVINSATGATELQVFEVE